MQQLLDDPMQMAVPAPYSRARRTGRPPAAARRVQIFEPFAGWHHTKYVATLLPALQRLLETGALEEVVVTTTDSHRETAHFRDLLEPFAGAVRFDTFAGDFRALPGHRVAAELLASLRRNRPDFVISTSANNGALALALRSLPRSPLNNGAVTSIGILHNGFADPPNGWRETLRDTVQRVDRFLSPWTELGVVNPLLYDAVRDRPLLRTSRVRLLPDPVPRLPAIDRRAARARLGLPEDGPIVAQIGKTDDRKAVPQLLAAFRTAGIPRGAYLLLAGELDPAHRAVLREGYDDLVAAGRIIVVDRYLHPAELHAATCAADVVSVVYHTNELSGNLLAAVAAERPVIARTSGYSGMMLERFGVGWGCDLRDPATFATALASGCAHGAAYTLRPQTRRLLEFHDPQNFAASVLDSLLARTSARREPVKSWAWVLG